MTRIEALTLNLADDVLNDAEERELRALLAESDPARQSYFRILQIEAGLRAQRQPAELPQLVMARLRAEQTNSLVRGVMTQIKSQISPELTREELARQDARILPLPSVSSRWGSLQRAALALAACIAIFAGIGIWLFGPTTGQPVLTEVTGPNVSIERGGKLVPAVIGTRLRDADTLRTTEAATAVISFAPEETRVIILPGTEFTLTSLSGGKHFDLDVGKLEASVARQRPFRPMTLRTPQAEARVIGTRFTLSVTTNSTRLDVTEGKVRFTRNSDLKEVRVMTGHYAVAAPDFEFAALPATGSILREYWTNVPGMSYTMYLRSNTNYPDHPSGSDFLTKLETPDNSVTNYGARIRGYLLPPATGDYAFWITAGDGGDLYLSPDDSPDHRQLIAHWEGPEPQTYHSTPFALKAGRMYYIEVLQKAGRASSHLAVEWQGPGRNREIISGEFLSPWKLK